MIQTSEIPALLKRLESNIADDIEGQELDFKQWEENFKERAIDSGWIVDGRENPVD